MVEIPKHAFEYETVRRLGDMLRTTKEDYETTESYALFATIVCWVMQRARTRDDENGPNNVQAREVGIALQGVRISDEPWEVKRFPEMSAFDFFVEVRNAVAHGDARNITPLNEGNVLTGQSIRIKGESLLLRRADMQRLGGELAKLFCDTMAQYEEEGDLRARAAKIEREEPG
ncbi:hypothetical protein PUV47_18715 [Pseudovibrio exalbescens]|uniref:hypothetical protein n=1 Tax=Pseudovibrio exalbescens TaxID=197461 RepID=UPI0023654DBF|nr:hypothetical protein [Pseudovibrio exalbescens]MDD7911969.1 hypothetical protein [Pseudovibrio exalbescens]